MRVSLDAVTSGEFLTRWSALLSLVVAGFFSIPSIGEPSLEGYARGVCVALIGWFPLAAVLVPIAIAERWIASRAVRGSIVLTAVLVASASRSFVNDAVSVLLFGEPTQGAWLPRIGANLITAGVLFTIVAVLVGQHRATARGTRRLRDALARVAEVEAAATRTVDRTRREVAAVIAGLRVDRDALLAGRIDFDAVRGFADRVRAASHVLASGASGAAPAPTPENDSWSGGVDGPSAVPPERTVASGPDERSVGLLRRLTPTPWLIVGLVYAVACAPFAAAAGGIAVAGAGLVGSAAIDVAANTIVRRFRRGAETRTAGIAFLVVWLLAGLAGLGLTFALLPTVGSLGLVPVLALPVIAVLVSLCRDALTRVRDNETHAAVVLAGIARSLADAPDRPDLPRRRAVDLLHGRLQGRCVVFAALADECEEVGRAVDAAEVESFRQSTDEVFAGIDDVAARTDLAAGEALDRLLAAWRPAVAVTRVVEGDAALALESAELTDDLVALVGEALVNAVKHSAARTATVELDVAASGAVRLQVRSVGRLAASAVRGLGTVDGRAHLAQDGDEVVFEAELRADGPDAAPLAHDGRELAPV